MSDYDDWSGEVGDSIADSPHAAHKPLPATAGEKASKGKGLEGIAMLRAIGIKPADPKWIDTTEIEADLLAGLVLVEKE